MQVARDVPGQPAGRLVPPRPVLLQALHHDPVDLAPHQFRQPRRLGPPRRRDLRQVARAREPHAGPRRLLLLDQPHQLAQRSLAQPLPLQRRRAGQQLIKQHPERVNVAPRVHPEGVHLRLLGAHVLEGADQGAELGEQGSLGQSLLDGLGHAEVDHLGHRSVVVHRDEHVRWLDIAVDDPLLVRVLDRLADRHDQLEPLAGRELVVVAVFRDRHAVDQLHDEVGPPGFGRPGVVNAGDIGVVHHRQRLALGLEPRDDLGAVHPGLDDLERDLAPDGVLLLGHVDNAHAPFADRLQQPVGADPRARPFRDRGVRDRDRVRPHRPIHEVPRAGCRAEQVLDLGAQPRIGRAGLVQECGSVVRRLDLQGPAEDRSHVGGGGVHRLVPRWNVNHLTNPVRHPGRITASRAEDFWVQPPSGASPPRERNSQARA